MKVVRLSALRTGRLYPQKPSGIEPATFRLVAQCFNHLRHSVPPKQDVWESEMYGNMFNSKEITFIKAYWNYLELLRPNTEMN
jgi:hypothetical protein